MGDECHVGLDEAGRGSLLGPLVVGAYAMIDYNAISARALLNMGTRDSKRLTPSEREEVYRTLKVHGTWATASAQPSRIDRYVSRGGLNMLEVKMMAAIAWRLKGSVIHVDACDTDATRFGWALVREISRKGLRVTVYARHKADRDVPLVSAASIVAKVTRDRALRRLGKVTGLPLGSGYPSDPVTRECVRKLLARGTAPSWIRRSWKTFDTLKPSLREEPGSTPSGKYA